MTPFLAWAARERGASLVELGLILFVVTFALQALAQLWLRHMSRSMGAGL